MSDFKTQEVTEMPKIFHLKLMTEKILKFLNATEVITSYDHIIHIQQWRSQEFRSGGARLKDKIGSKKLI